MKFNLFGYKLNFFRISLAKCSVEFDITIIDRLTALLNPPIICINENSSYNPWTTCDYFPSLETNIKPDSSLDLKITCPAITCKLR